MPTTGFATRADFSHLVASGRRFEGFGRVDAVGNGLLQLLGRWRAGECRDFVTDLGADLRIGRTPLAVATDVQHPAIVQLQGNSPRRPGFYALPGKQMVALDEHTSDPLWGHCNDLTNNAFDDGNNTAHGGILRGDAVQLLP